MTKYREIIRLAQPELVLSQQKIALELWCLKENCQQSP